MTRETQPVSREHPALETTGVRKSDIVKQATKNMGPMQKFFLIFLKKHHMAP